MDYSRVIADSAAKRLQALGGDALTLAELLGIRGAAPPESGVPPGGTGTDRIAIWEQRMDSGRRWYVRSQAAGSSWRLAYERWADVEILPPKGTKRRVVLLGESVARGYFYDPNHTPASVLEKILGRYLPEGTEVIDLAANDLSSAELLGLLSQMPALAPDALVIFAGNNWGSGALRGAAADLDARQSAAAALRAGGVPALKSLLEERVLRLISDGLRRLPRLLQAMNIPAVVVVPEFNLAHWKGDPSNNAPWLAGEANRKWWEHHALALQALNASAPERAQEHAEAMLALDGGTTHNAFEIIGTALIAAGRHAEARTVLERARDGRIWDAANLSPRCYATIQNGLRRAASAHVRVVDLPAVFATLNADRVPDRSVFMDYCHLSSQAIAVAMACVARALFPDIAFPALEAVREDTTLLPGAEVESAAHLLAAIHNAHWGQVRETIEHHVRIAAGCPATLDILRRIVDLQGRRVPAWMTCAAGDILQEHRPQLSRYFLGYGRGRLFDEHLLEAAAEVLDREVGDGASARLAEHRLSEWSIQSHAGRVDLLADMWTHMADQCLPKHEENRGEQQPVQVRGWYRAYLPVSRFPVISATSGAQGIHVELVCRRPPFFAPDGECLLRLNGERIGRFLLDTVWRARAFELPAHLVRAGMNTLEIVWPSGRWDSDAAIERAAAELESGRLAEMSPAFADIWSLWLYRLDSSG